MFLLFSPFSAYFSPHDIVVEKGLLSMTCSIYSTSCAVSAFNLSTQNTHKNNITEQNFLVKSSPAFSAELIYIRE